MENNDALEAFMRIAIAEARKSPPKPTNFCVGACLAIIPPASVHVGEETRREPHSQEEPSPCYSPLETGFTLECPGNTHAEQSCFIKLAQRYGSSELRLGEFLPGPGLALFTTMEPCNQRSIGNVPCVDRILALRRADDKPAIETVYIGVTEPETFVGVNHGRQKLVDAGIRVVHVPGFQAEILRIATAGHVQETGHA